MFLSVIRAGFHSVLFRAAASFLLGFSVAVVDPARADTVTLAPVKDNTLYEYAGTDLSNGAGDYFFTGKTNSTNLVRRAVIAFDLVGSIPDGSIINSAILSLTVSRQKNTSLRATTVHRLLASWGEGTSDAEVEEGSGAPAASGDATWRHRSYPATLWSTAGGDFVATASAATDVGGDGQYAWTSGTMAADVQGWLDAPSTNHGWILVGVESTNRTAKRFNSRENPDTATRPQLSIDFTPPAGTGACCQPDGGCTVTDQGSCTLSGGTYQGDGTSCTPNLCPQPTGACCAPDGDCTEGTQVDCDAVGGTYQGDGTLCATTSCPILTGACCLPGSPGSCQQETEADCLAAAGTFQGLNTDCQVDLCPFVDALPLPGVAVPATGSPGAEATYEIPITQFTQQLHRDLPPTTVWGFAGTYPGPTIEATRDQPVTVHWINDLRDSENNLLTSHYFSVDSCLHGPDAHGDAPRTVVHLHGGHVPAASDGYPEDTILPGQEQIYFYPNNQHAGTLWYHDHALGITRLNVYMGLAGFYLLRDSVEDGLNLPDGQYEIPLAIQDRALNADGSLFYPAAWQGHFFGDKVLVNGKVWPYLVVDKGKYRFRVLNGSNSRTYALSLSDASSFQQIGSEGGLLEAPVTVSSITLGPGERADVIIDFAGYATDAEIVLKNSAPAPFPGDPGTGVVHDVMKFIVSGQSGDTDALPGSLTTVESLDEVDAVQHRDLVLTKEFEPCAGTWWLINGLGWDDITEQPLLGTTEVWSFINRTGVVHPMHMHLVLFQVLDRQDFEFVNGEIVPVGEPVPPNPEEAGWKDTVLAFPNQITRVIARFEDYPGFFPYHCHVLEHEDHEMMRQFQVLVPGTIVIEKQTRPDGRTETFTFSGDVPGTISDGEQIVSQPLAAGAYSVTESVPSGWELTSVSCNDGDSTGNPDTATASINLGETEAVICTFTNCILDLALETETVNDSRLFEACGSIAAGNDFRIGAAGEVQLRARSAIRILAGFSVAIGGQVTFDVDPAL